MIEADSREGERAAGRSPAIERRHTWKLIGLFAAVALILFARTADAFLYPVMHFEDGRYLFGYYYNYPGAGSMFRHAAGYLAFLPELAGFLATRLRPLLAYYALGAFALCAGAAALSFFAARRFRSALPSDNARILICLALAAMPLGNYMLAAHAVNIRWGCLWMFVLLLFAPAPRRRAAWAMQLVLLVALAWSHPMSVLCLPFYALAIYLRPPGPDRWMNAGAVAALLLYVVFGVTWGNSGVVPKVDPVEIAGFVLHRSVFEAVLGNDLRMDLVSNGRMATLSVIAALLAFAIAAALFAQRRAMTREGRFMCLSLALLVPGLTAVMVSLRPDMLPGGLGHGGNHRYFYAQQLSTLLLAGYALALAARSLPARATGKLRLGTAAAAAAWFLTLNATNRGQFWTSRDEGRRVRSFVRTVDREIRRGGPEERLVLPRDGGTWSIVIEPASFRKHGR